MVSKIVSHCHVKGGLVSALDNQVQSILSSHNFVNQLDLLVLKQDSSKLSDLNLTFTSYIVTCVLSSLFKSILEINDESELKNIKLLSLNTDVSHELTISINNGMLTLKMPSDIYFKSGFKGKRSNYSKGYKNNKSQLFKVSIDLINFKEKFSKNEKNYVRLLWFTDNVIPDKVFKLSITSRTSNFIQNLQSHSIELQSKEIKPESIDLGVCKIPNLKPTKDQIWLSETLEWLSYASISGPQISCFDKTDSFVSNYSELLETESEQQLQKIQLKGGLIPTRLIQDLYKNAGESELGWFGLVCHGVRDCNVSFKAFNEHGFANNGENDVVVLNSDDEYVLWQVVAFGDTA